MGRRRTTQSRRSTVYNSRRASKYIANAGGAEEAKAQEEDHKLSEKELERRRINQRYIYNID